MRPHLPGLTCFIAVALTASLVSQTGHAQEDEIERGKAVVVGAPGIEPSQACMSCHGMEGQGDRAAGFPRLAGQSEDYILRALHAYASGERDNQIMAPIASALSEGQMKSVAAYYASMGDTPWLAQPIDDPELVQYGAAISSIGSAPLGIQGCINCHGPAGQGLPPNYPYLAGQPEAFLAARLREYKAMPPGDGISLPQVMAGIARRMGDREIEALSRYFASIAPKPVQAVEQANSGPKALQ